MLVVASRCVDPVAFDDGVCVDAMCVCVFVWMSNRCDFSPIVISLFDHLSLASLFDVIFCSLQVHVNMTEI